MLHRKTTFVLGAGASFDFGFPTGDSLQGRITELLRKTEDSRRFQSEIIWDGIQPLLQEQSWPSKVSSLLRAAERITNGMPVAASIDNFLHTHQNDDEAVFLRKLAIAAAILSGEQKSFLRRSLRSNRRPSPLHQEIYKDSWYNPFIKMLTAGTLSDNPNALLDNVSFIVFNYDRCLEAILIHAIMGYYAIEHDAASDIIANCTILHPYGSLGSLDAKSSNFVPFGDPHPSLYEISSGIRTFTESVESDLVNEIRSVISNSDTIVFLGFGFLAQNMQLLKPNDDVARRATRIHATTRGLSPSDTEVVRQKLHDFTDNSDTIIYDNIRHTNVEVDMHGFIDVNNDTCLDLMSNHRVRLAA